MFMEDEILEILSMGLYIVRSRGDVLGERLWDLVGMAEILKCVY